MAFHLFKSTLLPLALLAPSVLATANLTLFPSAATACDPSTPSNDLTYLTLPADGSCYPFSSIGSFEITGLDDDCWDEGFLVYSNHDCDEAGGAGLVTWGWGGEDTCTTIREGSFQWSCIYPPREGLGHGW